MCMSTMPCIVAVLLLAVTLSPAAADDAPPLRFDCPDGPLDLSVQSPLFELWSRYDEADPACRKLTDADFAEREVVFEDGGTTARFSSPPREWGGPIVVTLRFEPAGREVLSGLTVDNGSYFPVEHAVWPIWDMTEYSRDGVLLMPSTVGDAIDDPILRIRGHFGGKFALDYPGRAAMQYMIYYNSARSWYVSSYAPADFDEMFTLSGLNVGSTVRMQFEWNPFLKEGTWETPPCGFSVLPGGWHAGADLYASHMRKVFRPPALPKWMRDDFHGWVQVGLKGGNVDTWAAFDRLPEYYEEYAASVGLNTMHCFSWCEDGLDAHFPDRHPSHNLGTTEELTAALSLIKERGGHVILYVNGRNVDPDSDFFRRWGTYPLCEKADGGPRRGEVGIRAMYTACPATPQYQGAHLTAFADMITLYGAHAAQIDQVACCSAIPCYNESHGHRTPATGFATGLDDMLRRIHELYRGLDPDFFVWAEGMHERTAQFYEVSQSHGEGGGWSAGRSVPEQFRYTYPDFLCTGQGDSLDELSYSFGQGKPFDFQRSRYDRIPGFARVLSEMIAVRRAEPGYFLRGVFKDNVGLTVAGEDVRAWRIDRGPSLVGMCVNLQACHRLPEDEVTAWLINPRPQWAHRSVYPADLSVEASGKWLELTWTGIAATIIFEPEGGVK